MPNVPGLRSPYAKVGRLVYFGRMLDKIRLHAAGRLPADYIANLGDAKPGVFDARCCLFLNVRFDDVRARALADPADLSVLEWAEAKGGRRSDNDCLIWNSFMMKRGYHDPSENVQTLKRRIAESALEGRGIETFFDYIDADEGRDSVAAKAWESAYS